MVRFLSIDGAMNNWGLVEGTIDKGVINIVSMTNLHTKGPSRKTKSHAKNLYNAKRARQIAKTLKIKAAGKDIIFAELVGGGRNYAGATSLAMAMGLICSLNKPIIFVTPIEAKTVTGNKSASKIQMINWAVKKYPRLKWTMRKGLPTLTNEHLADSIAIAHAGLFQMNSGKKPI